MDKRVLKLKKQMEKVTSPGAFTKLFKPLSALIREEPSLHDDLRELVFDYAFNGQLDEGRAWIAGFYFRRFIEKGDPTHLEAMRRGLKDDIIASACGQLLFTILGTESFPEIVEIVLDDGYSPNTRLSLISFLDGKSGGLGIPRIVVIPGTQVPVEQLPINLVKEWAEAGFPITEEVEDEGEDDEVTPVGIAWDAKAWGKATMKTALGKHGARDARKKMIVQGSLRPQEKSQWTGEIDLPEVVAEFYAQVGPLDVNLRGYGNDYYFPSLAKLWSRQAGYRFDGEGKRIKDWPDDWLVLADEGADPFILEISTGNILHSYHDDGLMNPIFLFPDVLSMALCLCTLGKICDDAEDAGNFLDDDDLIAKRHVKTALKRLTSILGEEKMAETVLQRLGWMV